MICKNKEDGKEWEQSAMTAGWKGLEQGLII